MKTEKKIFLGGMNSDDAEHLMPQGDYRDALNIRNTSSRTDEAGSIENVKTPVVDYSFNSQIPGYTTLSIGSCEDKQNGKVYSFYWNEIDNHYIVEYDGSTGSVIFKDFLLGFDRYHLVDAEIVGDFLYWTDGYNEPRYLNVKRLKAGEYSGDIFDYDLNLIMKAPNYPLTLSRAEDSSFSQNYIEFFSFQFAYRIVYKDGQRSVLSPYSDISVATPGSANYISLSKSTHDSYTLFGEEIEIYFRTDASSTWVLFKKMSWSVFSANGANFYNDTLGASLPSSEVTKYFESIPLKSDALCVAKSRLFLAGNTEVYENTNIDISFTVQNAPAPSTSTANVVYFKTSKKGWVYLPGEDVFQFTGDPRYDYYYIYNSLYYFIQTTDAVVTDFTAMTSLTYIALTGYTLQQVQSGLLQQGWYAYPTGATSTAVSGVTVNVSLGNVARGYSKSRSYYKYGIVFKDYYNRSSGVITDDSNLIYIPEQTNTTVKEVAWSINTSNSTVPSWATSYQIVRTKNLRCTSFIHYKSNDVFYYNGVGQTSSWNFSETYSTLSKKIYVDINTLSKTDLGYSYQEGDLMDMKIGSTWHTLKITGQDSHYVVCQIKDIGTLSSPTENFFEIYSPAIKMDTDTYYEVANAYPILNSNFSITSGVVNGDVYSINRAWSDYISSYNIAYSSSPVYSTLTNVTLNSAQSLIAVEAMSSFEPKWQDWVDHTGRVNIVLENAEQKHKTQSIRFSNVITPGTLNNGIHSFELLNEDVVPMESGPIQKLVFTSGAQETGNVMLAIGTNGCNSIYIGESQLVDNAGDSVLAVSKNVIGTIRPLKGGYGTQNPESVKVVEGTVFWWDFRRANVVRYNSNGLFAVSDYKMKTYFKDKVKLIDSLNLQGMYAFGGLDKNNNEYLLSFNHYGDTVIDGYTATWHTKACVQVNNLTTGDYRMEVLAVAINADGSSISGYPINYSILNAFSVIVGFGGFHAAIDSNAFARLSNVDYQNRLSDFYTYIQGMESGFTASVVSNFSTGTDWISCPPQSASGGGGGG